jgi:hypothetical protein
MSAFNDVPTSISAAAGAKAFFAAERAWNHVVRALAEEIVELYPPHFRTRTVRLQVEEGLHGLFGPRPTLVKPGKSRGRKRLAITREKILVYRRKHPGASVASIAKALGVSSRTVERRPQSKASFVPSP